MTPFAHRPPGRVIAWMLLASAGLVACGGGGMASSPTDPPTCLGLADEVTWSPAGAGSSEWNDVLVDADQRIWLAGYAGGTPGQGTVDPGGNSRAVVRVLSPRGELLWDSGGRFDTPGSEDAGALALTHDGTVLVAGRTTGVIVSRITTSPTKAAASRRAGDGFGCAKVGHGARESPVPSPRPGTA